MNKDELIRPVNFETGETMYFDPNEMQNGNLVQITKEQSEEIAKKSSQWTGTVVLVDKENGIVTIK